jgi:integrase
MEQKLYIMEINGLELIEAVDFLKVCQKSANMKPYKKPILKDHNGNLEKSWLVEFYYWSDSDQKLKRKRLTTVPGIQSPNYAKSKKERYSEFKVIVDAIDYLLRHGWTPENRIAEKTITKVADPEYHLAFEAITRAASLKKNEVKAKTEKDYQRTASKFIEFLHLKGLHNQPIEKIKRAHVLEWLRSIISDGSQPKTRNNYLGYLSGLFEKLIEEEIAKLNPCHGIKQLNTTVELHQAYAVEEVKIISDFLTKHDPTLKTYIQFIGYTFLRPSEILSIKSHQVNLKQRTILLKANKAKRGKTEIVYVIDRLMPALTDLLSQAQPSDFLFSKNNGPGPAEIERTDLYSQRWNKYRDMINDQYKLTLGPNHTLYAMRHTFIQDIYRTLRKSCTVQEAEFKIQPITRHKTIDALRKYIRDYNFELAADWSESYSLDF